MLIQLHLQTNDIFDMLSIAPTPLPENPFIEDEEEMAAELAASLPDCLQNQPLPDIEADEFEKVYSWFLS